MIFKDRKEAGHQLAQKLNRYSDEPLIVLALPRGGLPVGLEVAKALNAPLNVIIARKLGLPGQTEFGVGAISEGNTLVLDNPTISAMGISQKDLEKVIDKEKEELNRRIKFYRQNKLMPDLSGKTVILVDDGLATGVTAKAAIKAVKKISPKKIIFASPVCAYDTALTLRSEVDDMVCIITPYDFLSVGHWYQNFPQLSDEEVIDILNKTENF